MFGEYNCIGRLDLDYRINLHNYSKLTWLVSVEYRSEHFPFLDHTDVYHVQHVLITLLLNLPYVKRNEEEAECEDE